jgi:short-subunit dehydrogenase
MTDSMALAEQVVLITGASAGIGAALAEVLVQRYPGIRLVLAARNVEKLEQVTDRCRKAGAEVRTVVTDMGQVEQAQALGHQALEQFGRVDVLVNNAGYGQMGPAELLPLAACQQQMAVNYFGPLALTQVLIPKMREQGNGRIVNISSIAGRTAFPFGGLYSSSKFALEALSDALRMELEPFNIQVSLIEPGPVSTNFFAVVAQEVERVIPDPTTSPYRAAFAKLEGLEKQTTANAWTAERVAEVIIRAMCDRRPRARYVAATGGDFLVALLTKILPTRLVDRFWQKFYGIDLVAQDWQAKNRARAEQTEVVG